MTKEKNNLFTAVKVLVLLSVLLSGLAVSMTACRPQQIVTGPGAQPTATSTPNANFPQITTTPNPIAGSIAITGILQNGNSSFSFVNTTASNIPSGTVIYFTNFGWDGTLNNNTGGFVDESFDSASSPSTMASEEGTISFTLTAALPPYTEVVIGSVGGNQSTYGTVANAGNGTVSGISNNSNNYIYMNHNGDGDKLFVYEASSAVAPGASTVGVTFINAVIFGPNTWMTSGNPIPANDCWDSYLPWAIAYSYTQTNTTAPTGTFANFCALDLSPLFNAMGGQNTNAQNQNGVLANCETTLSGIETGANWSGNDQGKTGFEFGSAFVGMSACGAGNAGYTSITASGETGY